MNAYDYAMKVEKEGEKYYRELANKASYTGLKTVFNILAKEEVKHYNVIKDMKKNTNVDLNKLDIILDTKTVYEVLIGGKDTVTFDSDEIQFYEEAIRREDNASQFYLDKANELEDENAKSIFIKLAAEEEKHKVLLENILSFIQGQSNLVEAAEF